MQWPVFILEDDLNSSSLVWSCVCVGVGVFVSKTTAAYFCS